MKTCMFINLDAATARRAAMEASFAAARPAGWSLRRLAATSGAEAASKPGVLGVNAKGCFLSHSAALAEDLASEDPVFIAEDDVAFSPATFEVVDGLLAAFPHWDIIFTDATIRDFTVMMQVAVRRDRMVERGEVTLLDLAGIQFMGAAAYVVRGSAKRALHAALTADRALDTPIDVKLGEIIRSGALRAGLTFPFQTGPSPLADSSQIQAAELLDHDRAISAFRRLMFVGRDLEDCRRDAAFLETLPKTDTPRFLGAIVGAFAALEDPG